MQIVRIVIIKFIMLDIPLITVILCDNNLPNHANNPADMHDTLKQYHVYDHDGGPTLNTESKLSLAHIFHGHSKCFTRIAIFILMIDLSLYHVYSTLALEKTNVAIFRYWIEGLTWALAYMHDWTRVSSPCCLWSLGGGGGGWNY